MKVSENDNHTGLKVHIDRLRRGNTHIIDDVVDPILLEIDEEQEEITANNSITIKGEAYLADSELFIKFSAKTEVSIPCSICNTAVSTEVAINDSIHAIPLDEIKGAVYHIGPLVRTELVLEIPHHAECNDGNCPQRKEAAPYIKTETEGKDDDPGHRPFADLEL